MGIVPAVSIALFDGVDIETVGPVIAPPSCKVMLLLVPIVVGKKREPPTPKSNGKYGYKGTLLTIWEY